MAGHSVPAVFRPTRWHSTADVTGSKRPQAGSSASLEGTWPPCCYARGPPLLSGGSASLFTSGYSATIERLYPCFDQAVPGEEPSDCSCASFSHRTAATIAVSNSAGSPVVVVAPVLPFPCYSSGVAPNTSPEDTPGDDQKCKPASLTLPVLPFVVGLENGQVWLYGWQSQPVRASAEEETLAKLEDPKCVAQHLVCRQMARPLSVCFSWKSPRPLIPSTEGGSASEDTERARSYFEVYVLYSNGVVVVWRQGRRDRIELPKVEGAVHMSVQEDGGFIAVSANTRKLTVFKRVDDGDTQKEDGSLSFQRCFEQEVFRKQLNSAVSKGYQLQTAWHPGNTSCLYIPGATNVRVLDMRTMKLESLAFASAGFDPLVVFDKIVLVSLQATRHDSISSPRSFRGVDGTDSSSCRNTSNKRTPSSVTVLLGSFRSTVRAWDLETHQLLFSIDTSYSGSPSRTGNEENLLHLAAWPAGPYSVRSKESEGSVKAEADVSPCVESLSSTQPFSPVLDVCLVRRDGAMSLMGLRPRQLLQRLSVQEECEELVEDAKEKRHGRDELPDATRKKNKDESEVDNQVTMKTDRESAVEESSDKEGKSMEPTHKQSKDVFPHSAGEDEAVEVDSFRDGRGISPSFEGGDHGKGVSKLCDSEERKAGGCLPDKTSSAVRSTSSPLRGKSEERTSVAVSSSSREFPETHTPERRGKAEKESKVIGGAEKEMAEPSSVPSQKEDRDSKKGKKKRDEKKRSRGVSTPLRRFVEMQAEEASEEDNEEGGNLFDDATIVGGVEEGTDDRRRRGRRGREKEDRQRRKKRRRKDMDSPREGKSDGEDDDDVASPSIVSSGSSVSSSSDEHSSSENGMDESGSDEDPDKGEEEELNAVDSEEENLFSLLSSTSFSVSSSSASASESPSQQDSDQKDRQNEGKGEKELLESMRMALVKMYAAQKQSRRVQREALRRARKLQHDNRRLRDELRRALSQKTAFSWRGEEDGSEEDSREVAPVVAPGMCKQPADAAKPWCLFWNQHGHVSKVTSAGKTVLEIFNFSPAAALSGSSRKRIADYTGACMAALSKVGVALASIGTRRPPLPSRVEFRSLQDSSQWTKSLPPLEKPTGIAVGDSFVAVTTSCDFLRIFATSGITLSLTKLPGVPVALCASQQLLFVVMATSSLETSTSSLELLNSREQRENQSRRYERLRKTTSKKKRFYTCLLLHIHPTPSSPASPYLLPFGCQDRISQLPGLLAKVFPSIDVIHEGPLVLDYPLDWINISTGGMAAIKDTSGQIWGLMPAWGRATEGPVPYRLSWLPLVNLSEAAGESIEETPRHVSSIKFWPLYVDEVKGEILVIRLKSHSKASTTDASGSLKESDEGTSSSSPSHGSSSSSWFHSSPPPEEPNCSQVSPLFGYTMEHLPLRLPFTDIWPYPRWQQLLLKDKHLKGIVASSSSSSSGTGRGVKDGQGNSSTSSAVLPMGEAALVPWQQFDEIRWRNEVVMRLMCIALRNWEGGGAGGGAGGPENQQDMLKMEQQKESADAEKKFTNLMKTHDRYALRQFLVCREDRRLHPAALDVAIRFKMPGVAAHARQSLEGDTRLQSEKLREALEWQVGEQQGGGEEELGLAGSLSPSSTQPLGSSYRSATLRTGGRHSFGSNENEKPAGLRGSWDSSDGAKRVTGGMNSKKLTDTLEEHPRRPSPVGQMQAPAAKSWMKGGNSGKSDRNQHHKFGGFLHVADS